jgi:hypothetical protein
MDWQIGVSLLGIAIAGAAVGLGFDGWEKAAAFVLTVGAALIFVYKGLKGLVERDQALSRFPDHEKTLEANTNELRALKEEVRLLTERLQERHADIHELRSAIQEHTEWKRDTPRVPKHLPRYPNSED